MSLQKTLEKFDEKFVTPDEVKGFIYGISRDEAGKIKSFISQKIKTALKSVVIEDKTFPEYQSNDFDRGYKFAREQQIKNNEEYLKN